MPGELAIRLADATPLILADLVCLALVLFLTTRLWVAAAPALGRRVGRWSAATALPLGLVASVVAHAWTPQRARELSEALDITAILVAAPIGLWWVGALIVHWTRRLLRRQRAAAPAPRASDWLRMVAATLPVLALAVLIQWAFCHEETKTLTVRATNLEKRLRALEATALKADEFFEENDRLTKALDGLRRVVPRTPEIGVFVDDLTPLARDRQIKLRNWTASEGVAVGVLHEHSVTLELEGDLRNLGDLVLRSRKLARLSVWHHARVRDGGARVRLTVYSSPRRAVKDYGDACAHPPSDVWLWPYCVKVAQARGRVDGVCVAIKRLSVVQSQVDAFQAAKAQLEDLLEAIETVRSSRGEFEVIEESPPREDDHGRAVIQQKET